MDASRRAASLFRAALIAAIVVPGVPAGAEGTGPDGSGGATGEAAAEAIVRGGAIAAFASVSEDSSKTARTLGKTYVPVDGMTLTVRVRRRSMLVIAFTAECKAYPPDSDPGAAGAVFVEARVNGARVPGSDVGGNVVFCGNTGFPLREPRLPLAVSGREGREGGGDPFRYSGPEDGQAGLSDRILDVLHDPRPG